MTYTQKLKIVMIATNINQVKLAELTSQSQENLSQKWQKTILKCKNLND
ncbi:MAG: hypothetical protein IJ301_01830 [Clostridia bacterium]|nr:hypothetical protein [Clostridia bacterium]